MLSTHEDLRRKVEAMERKYDRQFKVVFDAIKKLIEVESKEKRKIGFEVKEPKARSILAENCPISLNPFGP